MPLEVINPLLSVTFLAVCALIGDIALRKA
jgi:hypothetical protein